MQLIFSWIFFKPELVESVDVEPTYTESHGCHYTSFTGKTNKTEIKAETEVGYMSGIEQWLRHPACKQSLTSPPDHEI